MKAHIVIHYNILLVAKLPWVISQRTGIIWNNLSLTMKRKIHLFEIQSYTDNHYVYNLEGKWMCDIVTF